MKISRLEISSNVMCNNKSIFLEIDDEAQQAPPHASLSRFGCRVVHSMGAASHILWSGPIRTK
jgi:hypothetical protein